MRSGITWHGYPADDHANRDPGCPPSAGRKHERRPRGLMRVSGRHRRRALSPVVRRVGGRRGPGPSKIVRQPPAQTPDRPGLLLQDATGAGRLRLIRASGDVMRAEDSADGARRRRSFANGPASDRRRPPCSPGPGGPGEQTRHAGAASPAPNPHQLSSRDASRSRRYPNAGAPTQSKRSSPRGHRL
jgi:hypothetical protein